MAMKGEPDAAAVARLIEKLSRLRPSLALILGSGFQSVASAVRAVAGIDYADLPGFMKPAVPGHPGKLSIGYFGPTPIIVLHGRSHYYEGHSLEAITFPVRVLAELGIKHLVLTNAAGGIDRGFKPGDFMGFLDHLNLMGTTPLRGAVFPLAERGKGQGGEAFIDLTRAYDDHLRGLLKKAAKSAKVILRWGVYAAVCGP